MLQPQADDSASSISQRYAMKVQRGGTGFQKELKIMEQMESEHIVMLKKGRTHFDVNIIAEKDLHKISIINAPNFPFVIQAQVAKSIIASLGRLNFDE